jgi:hypothetical protein
MKNVNLCYPLLPQHRYDIFCASVAYASVEVGNVLASIVPNPSPLLEPRTRQELEQRLGAAEARKLRADAALERAQANLDQARADLERTRVLAGKGVAPASKLERDEILARIGIRETRCRPLRGPCSGARGGTGTGRVGQARQ